MKHCPNPECRFAKAHGYAAEYRDEIAACSDCGATLIAGDAPAPPAKVAKPRAPIGPIAPLVVTLAVPAIAFAASLIPIPGTNPVRHSVGFGFEERQLFGIGALGIMPIVSAYALVELIAVCIPRWRALRLTPEGRRVLDAASLRLGAGLALFQGWLLAVEMTRMSAIGWRPVVEEPGVAFVLIATMTLAAGTAVLLALARVIDRFGYGRGLVVLLVATYMPRVWLSVTLPWEVGEPLFTQLLVVAATVAVAIGSWIWFGGAWRKLSPDGEGLLRPPVSGLSPVMMAVSLVMLGATIATFGAGSFPVLLPGTIPYFVAVCVASVGFAILLGWLFARPKLVVAAWARCLGGALEEHAARFRRGLVQMHLVTCGIVLGVVIADAVLVRWLGLAVTLSAILLTAAVYDVIDDWRSPGFTDVWPVTRPYAIEPALRMLRAAGIDARVRSGAFYSLVPFTAPYAIPRIAVPGARAVEAEASLRRALASDEYPERAALEEMFA